MNAEEQQLIQAVVLGERTLDDPAVDALLRAQPALRAKVERMLRVGRELDAMAVEQAEILAGSAVDSASNPAEQREVEATLRRIAEAPRRATQGAGRRVRRVVPVLVAAAALLLAWMWIGGDHDGGSRTDSILLDGPGTPTDLEPRGSVASWGSFTWRGVLAPGDHWRVLVYDDTLGFSPTPVCTSDPLERNEWTPGPELRDRFPERIRWQVRRFAPDGITSVVSAEASARLGP